MESSKTLIAPYRMAGIDSFQQSALKTSFQRRLMRADTKRGVNHGVGYDVVWEMSLYDAWGSDGSSMREKAINREMPPLSSSFIKTAVAAEYAREGGVETRE